MRNNHSLRLILNKCGSFIFVATVLIVGGCATSPAQKGPRPKNWAMQMQEIQGLPNLFRVNDFLYRSAQPTKEGFIVLNQKRRLIKGDAPIKTILSLRAFNDDGPLVAESSTLHLEQIRFHSWHPEDEDVVKFLQIITNPALQPVLVHCQHGADRTGTMIAIYRIAYEGWTKKQATDEMVGGGYGFHPIWKNLLRYIEKLDVEAIKEKVAKANNK